MEVITYCAGIKKVKGHIACEIQAPMFRALLYGFLIIRCSYVDNNIYLKLDRNGALHINNMDCFSHRNSLINAG